MNRFTFTRLIGICALCLCWQSTYAEYTPMLELGKCWKHNMHNSYANTERDWTLKLEEETEIDGQAWFAMKSYYDGVLEQNDPICYLREDIEAKKIWIKPSGQMSRSSAGMIETFGMSDSEYVLYDFNDYNYTASALTLSPDFYMEGMKEGEINGFQGQVGEKFALLQGIGLVAVGIAEDHRFLEYQASSFLGMPALCDCMDVAYPFLYAVEDGQGQRVFEVPLLNMSGEESINADRDMVTVSVEDGRIVIRSSDYALAEVFDAQGKKLRLIIVDSEASVCGLQAGIYIIRISGKAYKAVI